MIYCEYLALDSWCHKSSVANLNNVFTRASGTSYREINVFIIA